MSKTTRKRLNLPHRDSSSLNTEQSETNGKPQPLGKATYKMFMDIINKNTKELEEHKKAIRFLLSTNKQFQNEIQKKEIKQKKT